MHRYPWIDKRQSLEYLVAHCVESAGGCSIHFQLDLFKKGILVSHTQISGALQRLKRKGIVSAQGNYWSMCK